jgi:hypothetical protein
MLDQKRAMPIIFLIGLIAMPNLSFGSTCNNVNIRIKNSIPSGKAIKIKDIKYCDYEDNRWRNEAVTNVDIVTTWTQSLSGGSKDLGSIGGEKYKIKVQFCIYDTGSLNCPVNYSKTFSDDAACTDGETYFGEIVTYDSGSAFTSNANCN